MSYIHGQYPYDKNAVWIKYICVAYSARLLSVFGFMKYHSVLIIDIAELINQTTGKLLKAERMWTELLK